MTKKIVLSLSTLLFLTACDPFEGLMSVKQDFILKSTLKSNNCNGDNSDNCDQIVNVNIPAGDVNAKFEFLSKTEIQIETKINGKKTTLNLNLPKKLKLPDNGNFSIAAADLGQDFGANGNTETKVTDGPMQQTRESCNYTRYETRCNVVNGQTVCHQFPVTVWGYKYSEFFYRDTNQKITVNFERDSILAVFNGQRTFSERIVRYEGQCF